MEKKKFTRKFSREKKTPIIEKKQKKADLPFGIVIPKPMPKTIVDSKESKKQKDSILSLRTKRSILDRKSSKGSESRSKSLSSIGRLEFISSQIFSMDDQKFLQVYKNDPFMKEKIDYILKKNEEKVNSDIHLLSLVKANISTSLYQTVLENAEDGPVGKENSFIRCKSQNDLRQTQECLRLKELITTSSQAYSGVSC